MNTSDLFATARKLKENGELYALSKAIRSLELGGGLKAQPNFKPCDIDCTPCGINVYSMEPNYVSVYDIEFSDEEYEIAKTLENGDDILKEADLWDFVQDVLSDAE